MDSINTQTEVTKASEASLGQDWLGLLRYWLRDRRVLIAIALAVVIGGAVLNWGWLVAIGVAPLLLGLAPCAAMCAIGLCSMAKGKGNAACGKNAASENADDRNELPSASQATKLERISESE
jgi:hypothetical protein